MEAQDAPGSTALSKMPPENDMWSPSILVIIPTAAPSFSHASPQAATPASGIPGTAAGRDHEAWHQTETGIVADVDEVGGVPIGTHSDGDYDSEGGSNGSEWLSRSVTGFVYENGRRYHRLREDHYSFPNDKMEQERENLKHTVDKLLCGMLYYAPIGDSPQRILDVSTGTGIGAIE